jgi:succinate dehydrogenase / fumarate reductase, cytochrome b subunit
VSTLTSSAPAIDKPDDAHAPVSYEKCAGAGHFWLRRVHSLFGLVFGGYVVVHLTVNMSGLWPRMYQQNVDKIHELEPMLPAIEIAAIFTPLVVHLLYGVYIASAGFKFNTMKYNYGGNVRYFLQRVTAFVLLAFLAYHIGTLHKWGLALSGVAGYPEFNPDNKAFQSTVEAIKAPYQSGMLNIAVMVLYLLGVWSATFHFANGLWTSAIAWGATTTARAQKRWGDVCCGLGIVLTLVGTIAWAAFTIMPAARDVSRWDNETRTYRIIKVNGEFVRVKAEAVPRDAELP